MKWHGNMEHTCLIRVFFFFFLAGPHWITPLVMWASWLNNIIIIHVSLILPKMAKMHRGINYCPFIWGGQWENVSCIFFYCFVWEVISKTLASCFIRCSKRLETKALDLHLESLMKNSQWFLIFYMKPCFRPSELWFETAIRWPSFTKFGSKVNLIQYRVVF